MVRFWKQDLTDKIATSFLLLSLLTVGAVGGIAFLSAREALKQAAFNRLSVSATLKEEQITLWFEEQQRDFLVTTQLPDLQAKLKILLDSSQSNPDFGQTHQILSKYLREVSQIMPNLGEIYVLDRSNKIILSSDKNHEGEYEILANVTYIERVELGKNFAPIFYVSPVTGKPAVTLAKTIKNEAGVRQGIILVNLNLEQIDRIVRERTGLGDSGETYLVGSLVSKNALISGERANSNKLSEGISSQGIDAAMSGMSGSGLYQNYAGVPVIGVYRWLNEQDLALLVEMSQEEAFAPARHLANIIMLMGLLSAGVLMLGVFWLTQQLTVSRQQLEDYSHQLETKAQEAETANRAKSEFLANMSHELRTPLNAILGFAQLMERDATLTHQQQDSLAIINRSGEHLLNLIDDVLDMSKIEAGQMTLNCQPFNLLELLHVLKETFSIEAEKKQLFLQFELAEDLPEYINGDRAKLRQVLINLLGNAIKFTDTGGVTLRVRAGSRGAGETLRRGDSETLRRGDGGTGGRGDSETLRRGDSETLRRGDSETGSGGELHSPPHPVPHSPPHLVPQHSALSTGHFPLSTHLYFEVQDTGRGIAPEEMDKLFHPFMQTASGVQSKGGTGLGLAISRQFVQLMGGDISINSTVERGSIFRFEIATCVVDASEIEQPSVKKRVIAIAPDQPTYRILVVDDRPENCNLLKQLLDRVGFQTQTAANGKEAIAIWQQWQPHLIWMDMRMPVMDGYEAARQIKAHPQGQKSAIVALTASAFEEQRATILASGCDDMVRKPFQEQVIFDKMAKYLGVVYLYEDLALSDRVSSTSEQKIPLTPEDLKIMPEDWRQSLYQAATQVDGEWLDRLIAQIPESERAIAQKLTEMNRNYCFDEIMELTAIDCS
jgi:signal transduction histidine kinase/DNA-binding NarL/FixJ family response regulator